jgi:hypothetical protein
MDHPYVTLPRGTILYRAASDIQNWHDASYEKTRECCDTGKTGAYFSTYPVMALAMLLEYERDMPVGVFELQDDVELFVGKYSFRYMNPSRYLDAHGSLIANVSPTDDENINHCDPDILPIDVDLRDKTDSDMEVFIANDHDLKKVHLTHVFDVKVDALQHMKSGSVHPHDPILHTFGTL